MNDTLKIILYSSAAGLPVVLGGTVSSIFQSKKLGIKSEVNHWVIAFGGGTLVAAISFALVPRAMPVLSLPELSVIFLAGALSFLAIDVLLDRIGGSLAQVLSMMMDSVPEWLALGASFAHSHSFGLLLAIFIGLQNLPEGFNSYVEIRKLMKKGTALLLMLGLSFIDIFASLCGEFLLADRPQVIASIMIFAAGGILYLIFQDIAPLSKRKKDWIPATGACFGFLLGMIGERLIL